jgi:hypothetical protein
MDSSRFHNGEKVVEKMSRNHMIPLDHPPHSPELSPSDLRLFGVSKNRMKATVFGNADEVDDFVCYFWSELTLDEVRLVFRE